MGNLADKIGLLASGEAKKMKKNIGEISVQLTPLQTDYKQTHISNSIALLKEQQDRRQAARDAVEVISGRCFPIAAIFQGSCVQCGTVYRASRETIIDADYYLTYDTDAGKEIATIDCRECTIDVKLKPYKYSKITPAVQHADPPMSKTEQFACLCPKCGTFLLADSEDVDASTVVRDENGDEKVRVECACCSCRVFAYEFGGFIEDEEAKKAVKRKMILLKGACDG